MFKLSFPLYDVNASSGSKGLGNLPEWDLSDLYSSPDAPELARDLKWLDGACAAFAKDYEGKLAQLDSQAMLDCVLRNERINAIAGRVMSFAGLRYYQLTIDDDRTKFMSDMQENITNFTTPLVFFTLELNSIDDAALQRLLDSNSELARYRPVFDRIRALKPYQLSDELEKFLHDLGVVDDAWERLFDETIAGLTFEIDGESLNIEGALNLLTDPDRDQREKGAVELARVFAENIKIFARVHNTQAKEKDIIDHWRGMPTPQTGRHLSNHVEPEVVEALRNAVVAAYPKLSHRYYQLKRKWLGLDVMQVWDRNAPLPMENTRIVGWSEAQQTVLQAYGDFDPRMADLAAPFFSKGWIDAADGKHENRWMERGPTDRTASLWRL
jgi:oligoendopeptidase F